eukprot:Em0005g1075a
MASKIIYFGHITSYGESGFNSSGAVPAVELAVEHVNNNASILAGYKLVSTPVMDSECDRIKSLDAFFSSVVYATSRYNVIALLGCGCGVATEPVAEISHRWNITQVSYASGSSSLSNRAQFKNYFRIWPSFKDIAPGLVSILKHYNWTRVSFLTQKENLFTSLILPIVYSSDLQLGRLLSIFPSPVVSSSNIMLIAMHFHASISSFVRKDFTAALPKLVNDTTFVVL